ncbi:hypothetical protein CDV36_015710 [Fusarium kuroshium]|uniref:Uncharacterized protein n=1 Tax=Fusarium kuroshium TaxID=2010991 RepID=A0A3M2R8F7_9HYPO|nr:hypothetical protein CDV36_015710 [Fusarium kuroshium]
MTLVISPTPSEKVGIEDIAGALKTCLDILSNISANEDLEGQWDMLQAKLDIERTLLLQWSDRVKLLQDVHDDCLDDLRTHNRIFELLHGAVCLLTDKHQMRWMYQVFSFEEEEVSPDTTYLPSSSILSTPRMEHFNNEFLRLNLRAMQPRQGLCPLAAPHLRVATLVVTFEKFIEHIQQLVSSLYRITGGANCLECATEMAKEDVKRCNSMRDMRLVRNAAEGVRDTISQSARDFIVQLAQERVLKTLWFPGMEERKMNLREAHPDTFLWSLRAPQMDEDWDDLAEWLVSGSDIYWVCGKAGTGKSTLLKYLFNNPDTKRYLEVWGDNEPVSLGSFFFWSQGLFEQRVRDGMARAMLYHILSEIPRLMPVLVPTLWYHAKEAGDFEQDGSLPLPMIPDVRLAFEKLEEPGVLNKKFCFFIDGLDEYGGSESRAVDFIQRLSRSDKIKVIASSRPHPTFLELLGDYPKMSLHELTGGDILQYVQDKVDAHPYMRVLRDVNETRTLVLIEMLADRAEGVFLWGVLAIKAFLKGLDAFESLPDLEDRVRAIPKDLPGLYRHMLNLVEPRHREGAAKMLRMCHRSKVSRMRDGGSGRVWAVGLAALDGKGMEFDNFEHHSENTLRARHRQCLTLENRLASRCGGLLEVIRYEPDEEDSCFCGRPETHPTRYRDILIDSSIEFVHRSAFEWFDKLGWTTVPWVELRDQDFQEDAALASMAWHQSRISHDLGASLGTTDTSLSYCMEKIHEASKFTPKFAKRMLLEIKQLVADTRRNRGENWRFTFCCLEGENSEHLEILYFGVAMGMANFVRYYMRQHGEGRSLRDLELEHGMNWWRVAADRSLVVKFLEGHIEAIQNLPPQREMMHYLAQIGCPVPRSQLVKHLTDGEMAASMYMAVIEDMPH